MKTPSEIKLVPADAIPPGHLCLLTLGEKLFLAFSCTFPGAGYNKAFVLINDKMPDGRRIYLWEPNMLDNIHDLGTNFSIRASLHLENVFIGVNIDPDNILACAQDAAISQSENMSYKFVNRTTKGMYYADINDGSVKGSLNSNADINFRSWQIINNADGEIIYSYSAV